MNRSKPSLLLHPLFLCSLLLLLLNDHWWKQEYPNLLTGKLSDFTGIFVLTLLLQQFFPGKKTMIYTGITLFFIYWKSPLSQPLIDWCNYALLLPVVRVVDYTDLLALVVLWPAYRLQPIDYHGSLSVSLLKVPVMAFTFFAIAATSMPMRYMYRSTEGDYLPIDKSFKTKLSREVMLQKLDSLGISYHLDSIQYFPAYTNNYFLQYPAVNEAAPRRISVDSLKEATLVYQRKEDPYYVIPSLLLGKDTLHNVQFRITGEGRKRMVEMISLTMAAGTHYGYNEAIAVAKKYKNLFQAMLTN
jgi:hypothetical protein